MKMPTREQSAYTMACIVESMIQYIRYSLECTELNDLVLISDFDKARLCLKCAIARMQELAAIDEDLRGKN